MTVLCDGIKSLSTIRLQNLKYHHSVVLNLNSARAASAWHDRVSFTPNFKRL